MEPYQNPQPASSESEPPPSGPAGGGEAPLLVNRCISQTSVPSAFLVYPSSLKIVRPKYALSSDRPPPVRTDIQGFSDHSRRRLRFLAGNTSTPLISQFCLTYHQTCPDGHTIKKHLNSWLTNLRKRFPEVHYLWILEFQKRGTPHFHCWLSLPHDLPGLRNILAKSWNRIAEPDSPEHLAFHNHKDNFVAWDMYSPGYLCKYLDKEYQKCVPSGYSGVGRFWGNSRGLLAVPEEITPDELAHLQVQQVNEETGEIITTFDPVKYIIRTVGRLHEKKLKRSKWRSRARKTLTSCTIATGSNSFRQTLQYLRKEFEQRENLPF